MTQKNDIVFHCTTPKKLARYNQKHIILPPVRYWTTEFSALRWMRRTGRSILLVFEEPKQSYPLPMKGGAKWTDQMVRNWRVKQIGDCAGLENQ